MEKRGLAGSSGGYAWSGRAKPRPALAERQVATETPVAKQTARKTAPGPRAWEEQLELQDQESEDEEVENAEAEEQDLDEELQVDEKDRPKELPRRVQYAVKRAPPMGCDLHTLSRQEFDTEVVCRLRLKLNQFLETGASLVDTIQEFEQLNRRRSGLQRPRVGAEVLDVVQDIASKNFEQSERLVKALIQFQAEAPGQPRK